VEVELGARHHLRDPQMESRGERCLQYIILSACKLGRLCFSLKDTFSNRRRRREIKHHLSIKVLIIHGSGSGGIQKSLGVACVKMINQINGRAWQTRGGPS